MGSYPFLALFFKKIAKHMPSKSSFSRMYQMGPKSPSVNGSGKPQVVSDAQAREKLAVSL